MPLDILIYQDGYAALGMMVNALKTSFNDQSCSVAEINIDDIRNGTLRTDKPTLLVIPGIYGEDCHYHNDFDEKALSEIHSFLEQGGVSLHSCAGASAVSRLCTYVTPWNVVKHRTSLNPIFNGHANGPLWPYAVQPQTASKENGFPLANTSIAPVIFKNENGEWEQAHISYGNGPGLIACKQNADVEILARYNEIDGQPAALLRIAKGQGAAYLCSPHPENAPAKIADNIKFAAMHQMNGQLLPHEDGRQKFWSMLTGRIRRDLKLVA